MTKEEKLTSEVVELKLAIREFIKLAPSFNGDCELAKRIGVALANVETNLHWNFDCWELGLPE